MRQRYFINTSRFLFIILQCLNLGGALQAQQTTIKDYVLFGGSSNCPGGPGQKPCAGPGCAVQLGSFSDIQGGSVGSYRLVKSTGKATVNANIYSGGAVQLSYFNTVTGKISASNAPSIWGATLIAGPGSRLMGNIDVNGNIKVVSGVVNGKVTHPGGTTYNGPAPAGGNITGTPSLALLPQMPSVTSFPACPNLPDINSTRTIVPGVYDDIKLPGNKTLTFSGPGEYFFDKIDNRGGTNFFVFDFKNSASGTFKIFVHNDADLGKISASMINGGSATRIFTEVHGNGSSSYKQDWCFNLSNCSPYGTPTKWLGTVWAPYAAINIGSGTGNSMVTGALWSGTQVNVQCGAKIIYAPFSDCNPPVVNAGPDKALNFQNQTVLTGTSTTPGASFSWKVIDGGVITSPSTEASITVSAAGTYILTVTTGAGCFATDTAIITGKVNTLIGSELQSIYQNFNPNDPPSPFFVIRHDSVLIDVIAKEGRYNEVLQLLTGAAYGLTDIRSNGSSNFIITGLFQISKLPLLNALDSIIVYCRPFYGAFNNNGIANSAGDTSVRSNLVREGYKLQGAGVKVGVISDSYNTITSAGTNPVSNTAAQDVGNGDLPGAGNPNGDLTPVHVLKEYPTRSSDEGRGMLQIVHDLAPKSELYFRTGFISAGDFALGIEELHQAGCNIIVDDVTFLTEPFLKDGVVAAAVDNVTANGATYFSAAGNFSNKSYENVFNPVPAPAGLNGTAHSFQGNDIFQSVNLVPGNYTIVLQWVDDIYSLGQTSSGGTRNDLDIYLTPNTDGTALFGFNRNNTNGDPIEILPFTVTTTQQANILIINNTTGSTPARFKYIVFRGDIKINEYPTGTSTLVGQANAAGAIAVGAVRYDKIFPYPVVDSVEFFSSTGGTFIDNIQRRKPDLVAPDGVNTTVNLGNDYDGNSYSNFFGTSAAAPHAAAVAALIMEGKRKFLNQAQTSSAEIRTLLQTTATDMIEQGFDFISGYGLINADSAMRTFATPTPSIVQLVYPQAVIPGQAPFTLTVKGKYLTPNSVIRFRDIPLTTILVNATEVSALIPAFIGNPAISVYTPPVSSSGLDGGSSDTLYFFDVIKKKVIVTVENKTKKYGELLPGFTANILVDSIPLANTSLSIKELGLDSLDYITLATAASDVGTYIIRPTRIFDPLDSVARGLLELYDYTFNQGTLTIGKLPVSIIPHDTTVTYGQKIPGIEFSYRFDGTNISDSTAFLNEIMSAHQSQFAKDAQGNDVFGLVNGRAVTILNGRAVTILNGRAVTILNGKAVTILNGQTVPVVNAQALTIVNGIVTDTSGIALTQAQLDQLNFLTTLPSLQNARPITSQTLVNGAYVTSTTNVVDITQESILDYNGNAAQTYMLNAISGVHPKGLADVESFVNGRAVTILNGRAVTILNGRAVTILNGRAVTILNGRAVTILNGDTIPIVSSQNKTAVIIDSNEIGQDPPSQLKSLNMLTGLDAGNQFIIPGSLQNDNFDITYGLGKLTVLPAPLTVKAKDTTKVYGQAVTFSPSDFTISAGVLMYDDAIERVTISSTGAGADRQGGTHPVIASGAVGTPGTDLSNYSITYTDGMLTVLKAPVIVRADNKTKVYGDLNPPFTASYQGLVNGQDFTTSGITGEPAFSTDATTNSCAGNYAILISQGSLVSPNYSFSFLNGTLTISKACLDVKADDKVIYKGDVLPVFTSTVRTLKAGDNPMVSYFLSPSCAGSPGVYTIIPVIKHFSNSKNYTIKYTNGNLYINPRGWDAKKLRTYLECVEEGSPGSYTAHFYCINDNRTTVYVPGSEDNKLSSGGSFDGSAQPVIFAPGITRFDVHFDGSPVKWELRTYDCFSKTLCSAVAAVTSARCNTAVKPAGKTAPVKGVSGDASPGIVPANDVTVYPNPATTRAVIYFASEPISQKGLSLFDSHGKLYPVGMVKVLSKNAVEINVSGLAAGTYFIRVKASGGYRTVSLIKK